MPTPSARRLPATSLIICSRNRPGLLAETVQSVLAGHQVPTEIVIIDQSDTSAPDLEAMKGEPGCQINYRWQPSRGVSLARNTGVAAARYDHLAFIDDDVLVAPGWFEALIKPLVEGEPRSVVTGRVLSTAPEVAGGFAPALVTSEAPAVYAGRLNRDVLEAGNFAIHRAVLDEVGGFDVRLGPGTSFPAGEDNDLGLRILNAGYQIRYVPEAVLYHRAWRTKHDYLQLRWRYGIGQGAYFGKHLSWRDRYMLRRLGRLLLRHLGVSASRVRREPRKAVGHLLYSVGVLYGAARWLVAAPRATAGAASSKR